LLTKTIFDPAHQHRKSYPLNSSAVIRHIDDGPQTYNLKGKRIFIKDIIHYLVPPDQQPATIAPSLQRNKIEIGTHGNGTATMNGLLRLDVSQSKAPYPFRTEAEPGNPTVVPSEMLAKFHFTFLIRDPHSSIPSYYRCTVPPLDEVTGFYEFYPSEAGYDEVRRVFDYLRKIGHIGLHLHGSIVGSDKGDMNDSDGAYSTDHESDGSNPAAVDICVVDADDLLKNPAGIIEAYCRSVDVDYVPEMLSWDDEKQQTQARETFEKWPGFHEDAMNSKELKPSIRVSSTEPRLASSCIDESLRRIWETC
jgi:hypothetical protein